MRTVLIGFGVGLLVMAILVTFGSESTAMKQCQQTHSYDTCFQLLNR